MRRHSLCRVALFALTFGAPHLLAQEPPPPLAKTEVKTPEDKTPSDKPLPAIDTLITRARDHYSAQEELRKNYTYRQTVVADEFDSKGTKKGTHTDEYQIFFVDKYSVQQHIGHDGKPLSENDAKKEQERVNKVVASMKDGTYKRPHGGVSVSASNMLKVAVLSNERRETVNGRATIVVDFKGDPKAKTTDISQEVMQKLTGTVWLDEKDAVITRWHAELAENFHVGGGLLVNVKKGSHFDFVQAPVNGEIWFLKSMTGHADGRILLFKGFNGDFNASYSDYRKMKTTVTILPGSQVIGEDGKPIPNIEAEPEAAAPKPLNP